MVKENLIDLDRKQLKLLQAIIKTCIPGKTVWAYGSRVFWKARENSDLDLAVFGCSSRQIYNFKEALEESNLLVSVDVMDWESIPESFKVNIKKKYVVLQKSEDILDSQENNIEISISREHAVYARDIEKCFGVLNVKVQPNFCRKSIDELPMKIIIFLTEVVVTGAFWELLKAGIKKVFKNFNQVNMDIDDNRPNKNPNIMRYTIDSDGNVFVYADSSEKIKEYSYIKTIDDLLEHLKNQASQSKSASGGKSSSGNMLSSGSKLSSGSQPSLRSLSFPRRRESSQKKIFSGLTDQPMLKGWRKVKLKEIINLIGGGTPKTNIPEYWNGNIPWLSVTDFNTGRKYVYSTEKYITNLGLQKSNTKILNKDDIIISARGTVGVVSMTGKEMAFNQSCYGIRAKDESFNEYIYYLLKNTVNQLQHISHGGVFDTITRDTFNKVEVPLPPLLEQKAIAEVLSSLDDKIELLHEQNKTLEEIAQTLFRKWFIQDANPHWPQKPLDELLSTIESGSRPKGGINPELKQGIPNIGAESINGIGRFDFSKTKYVTDEFFKNMKKGVVKDYDVLIYKDGAYIGKKAMFGNGFPFKKMAVNEHVFILRTNSKADQFFLYFSLEQKKLSKLNANSAQPGLNQKSMKSLKIIIPQKDIINNFQNTVKPWIDKILFNSNQIRNLADLRNTLLPKLITGQVRVTFKNKKTQISSSC